MRKSRWFLVFVCLAVVLGGAIAPSRLLANGLYYFNGSSLSVRGDQDVTSNIASLGDGSVLFQQSFDGNRIVTWDPGTNFNAINVVATAQAAGLSFVGLGNGGGVWHDPANARLAFTDGTGFYPVGGQDATSPIVALGDGSAILQQSFTGNRIVHWAPTTVIPANIVPIAENQSAGLTFTGLGNGEAVWNDPANNRLGYFDGSTFLPTNSPQNATSPFAPLGDGTALFQQSFSNNRIVHWSPTTANPNDIQPIATDQAAGLTFTGLGNGEAVWNDPANSRLGYFDGTSFLPTGSPQDAISNFAVLGDGSVLFQQSFNNNRLIHWDPEPGNANANFNIVATDLPTIIGDIVGLGDGTAIYYDSLGQLVQFDGSLLNVIGTGFVGEFAILDIVSIGNGEAVLVGVSPIPEPSSLMLLSLGAIAVLQRFGRRKR